MRIAPITLTTLLLLGTTASAGVTLLVDFGPFTNSDGTPVGSPDKADSTADDFALADPNVDRAAPVNHVALNLATTQTDGRSDGLTGPGIAANITYDNNTQGFGALGGDYIDAPILDCYLYTAENTATLTVGGLEEIPAGDTVTVTTWGGGDQPGQDTTFAITYNGVSSNRQTVAHGEPQARSFRTFTFTKARGVDDVAISYGNPDNFAGFGGFSITTAGEPELVEPE